MLCEMYNIKYIKWYFAWENNVTITFLNLCYSFFIEVV